LIRGIVSAILSSLDETSTPETGDHHEIMTEIQEINSRLSRTRLSDMIPPDLEAEEHARQHQEEEEEAVVDSDKLELLESMMEQMNTDSEKPDGHLAEKLRPMGDDDVKVLRSRLDQLVVRLGMDINYYA
jgi:ribosomal protein S4